MCILVAERVFLSNSINHRIVVYKQCLSFKTVSLKVDLVCSDPRTECFCFTLCRASITTFNIQHLKMAMQNRKTKNNPTNEKTQKNIPTKSNNRLIINIISSNSEDLILTFLFYLALFVANSDYVLGLFLTMTAANGLGIYLHTSHSSTTLRLNFCFNTKFSNL